MPAESWNEHKNIPKEDPHQNALQREVLGLERLVNSENAEHNRTGADTHHDGQKPSTLDQAMTRYLETHDNWEAINKAVASGDTAKMKELLDANNDMIKAVSTRIGQIPGQIQTIGQTDYSIGVGANPHFGLTGLDDHNHDVKRT